MKKKQRCLIRCRHTLKKCAVVTGQDYQQAVCTGWCVCEVPMYQHQKMNMNVINTLKRKCIISKFVSALAVTFKQEEEYRTMRYRNVRSSCHRYTQSPYELKTHNTVQQSIDLRTSICEFFAATNRVNVYLLLQFTNIVVATKKNQP